MKKIIGVLLAVGLLLGMSVGVFAEGNDLSQFSDKFDIYTVNEESTEVIFDFSESNYIYATTYDGGYGAKDFSGNVIVKPEFADVQVFSEGLAAARVYENSPWGYINEKGEWVIEPQFSQADSFSCGLAVVYKNGQSGYIDKTGKFVYIADYNTYVSRFNNGFAVIFDEEDSNIHVIDTAFNNVEKKDKFFTIPGAWLSTRGEDRFILSQYYNGSDTVTESIVDKDGNVYATFENDAVISNFIDGKAIVTYYTEDFESSVVKLIDVYGKESEEFPTKILDGYMARVAKDFNVLTTWTYENDTYSSTITVYDDSFNLLYTLDNYYAYIDEEGYKIRFIPVEADVRTNYFLLSKNKKHFENTNTYTYVEEENGLLNGVIVLKINDSRAFVDDHVSFIEYNMDINNPSKVFIYNDRTMVPIRFVSENITFRDYYVDYNEYGDSKEITISGDKNIRLYIGSNTAYVSKWDSETKSYIEKPYTLDAIPMIVNDRTYVPIRFISECMDLNVEWDPRGYVIIGNKELVTEPLEDIFKAEMTIEELPRIDGSTATIPLSVAVTEKLLGLTSGLGDGYSITNHNKTEQAFLNLLDGEADLLYTGTPNEKKINQAKEKGMELEYYPFAKDAFVFIVNKDNPVDTLTTEQIKKIYSGEITNWKEVGGNDAEIIAYQRNEDSGSQNLMKKFMGDTPLMAPKIETVNEMGGMIDYIAEYDNNENAIGYTVNYYLSNMYYAEDVKVIKLNGVEPTAENIIKNIYPSTLEYAVVFNHNEPKNSNVRKVVDFIKSEEGKKTIIETNFVPIN